MSWLLEWEEELGKLDELLALLAKAPPSPESEIAQEHVQSAGENAGSARFPRGGDCALPSWCCQPARFHPAESSRYRLGGRSQSLGRNRCSTRLHRAPSSITGACLDCWASSQRLVTSRQWIELTWKRLTHFGLPGTSIRGRGPRNWGPSVSSSGTVWITNGFTELGRESSDAQEPQAGGA